MMNIAVLSDIHGNGTAFKTCLDYLKDKDIDAYCFLGDYAGEFPGVRQTVETLYDLKNRYRCFILRGNKENYLIDGLGKENPEWKDYPSTTGMLRYAYDQLTKGDIAYFKSLPISMRIENDGLPDIVICHGSPRKVNEKFTENEQILKEIISETKAGYIVCGHTHMKMDMQYENVQIWNPGSAGASFDMPFCYRFMILHGTREGWEAEFISLEADAERLLRELRDEGLYETAPFWTRFTELQVTSTCGEYTHGDLLNRAMDICRDQYGECVWPKVPEDCFVKAFEELFPRS